MDQEKIGKFIKKRREELNLTQKELAEKVFISDKTVSKWEKGRGLMDITMLKPLSQVLNVTIPELINGDFINKENEKDEVLNNTFKYINKKHKKDIFKIVILIFLIPIIIFFISYVSYKAYLINKYTIKENKNLSLYLKSEEPNYISTKLSVPFLDNKVIKYGNFYITDKFTGYVYKEPKVYPMGAYNPHKYIRYDKNNNVIGGIMFLDRGFQRQIDEFINNFSKESLIEHNNKDTYYLSKAEIYQYFENNHINDDLDLIKYCRNNYYFKNSIFKSISSIKENRTINKFCYRNDNMTVNYNITYLKGDYKGFILDIQEYKINPDMYNQEDKEIFSNLKRRDLYILSHNRYYMFTFFGEEETSDKYIKEFIKGLWIIY